MVIQLKLASWDRIFEFDKLSGGKKIVSNDFKIGDYLVVKIDSYTDLGRVVGILDKKEEKGKKEEEKTMIIRKANADDLENMKTKEKEKRKILKKALKVVKESKLPIKFVDFHHSFDAGKIVFAFISPEKIDFRKLVKELSKEFHKSIRMHQINPREEMKIFPGFGSCGRRLCCFSFLKTLGGISTDLIEEQQLIHRGTERLSGPCGRLKCCLNFETNLYKELIKSFPLIGTKIKIKDKIGEVVGWHIMEQSIDFKIDKEIIIKVPISEIRGEK